MYASAACARTISVALSPSYRTSGGSVQASVCGSTYGSILLTSKLAGENIALRRELVDFRESDPDSPAHALAAEAAFCHTALPEGPAVSVMMSGKAISRPPAAKRRREH